MSLDGNNDGTSFKTSEPILCASGCGFFGSAATNNLCSKCFRDLRIHEEQAVSAKAAVDNLVDKFSTKIRVADTFVIPESISDSSDSGVTLAVHEEVKVSNRCTSCRKKVGVLGFTCRCGSTFCGVHRYPEKHECGFDFKSLGKDAISRANPVVKADKIQRFFQIPDFRSVIDDFVFGFT